MSAGCGNGRRWAEPHVSQRTNDHSPPTDAELESLAQTWSEHCSHKTLAGRIHYRDESGERLFENMLRETIFAATQKIRQDLGPDDWCVSVFADNAGVIRFDEAYDVANRFAAMTDMSGVSTWAEVVSLCCLPQADYDTAIKYWDASGDEIDHIALTRLLHTLPPRTADPSLVWPLATSASTRHNPKTWRITILLRKARAGSRLRRIGLRLVTRRFLCSALDV